MARTLSTGQHHSLIGFRQWFFAPTLTRLCLTKQEPRICSSSSDKLHAYDYIGLLYIYWSEVEVREHLTNCLCKNCDHNILAWKIDCNAPVVLTINKSSYVFHKGDYEGFRSYLAGISWEDLLNNCDTINRGRYLKM